MIVCPKCGGVMDGPKQKADSIWWICLNESHDNPIVAERMPIQFFEAKGLGIGKRK